MVQDNFGKKMEEEFGEKEEFSQENCCQKKIGKKNVGPKKFLVSKQFCKKKFVSKNIWCLLFWFPTPWGVGLSDLFGWGGGSNS